MELEHQVHDTGIFVAPVREEQNISNSPVQPLSMNRFPSSPSISALAATPVPIKDAPVKILLVDDHPENLLALEATLGRSGGPDGVTEPIQAEFIRARSGPEALRKILQANYAVILLDVQMPEMDGYETAELIRKRRESQYTPIIFLTAVSTSEINIFRGYSLGAVDYITKPFDPWVLKAKVGVFVDLFRKRQEIERMADELRHQTDLLRTKSEELRLLNQGLEHRVAERTRELELANQDLWKAKETAELANSAKDKFLAVLSHELRTPLTPVLAIVQMLGEDPSVPADAKSWVETIGRNVQLEARLIDDLLDLTRIANGKLELHISTVDVHKLIHETIEICNEEVSAKKLTVSVHLNASNSLVRADSARLHQVLWNVLKNAIKFTPERGVIDIHTSITSSGTLQCQIKDSGIGIPKEHLKSVFQAFDQGSKEITRRFGGLGLGLAISKALIDQHQGTISADSDGVEKGATFTIEIPIADASQGTVTSAAPTENSTTERTARILLVEDNSDTSRAMQVLLERKGYLVTVANSVQAAVEKSQENPFDLVVSDIGLPDGDGFEVMRRLKAIRPIHGVAISGFGMDEDRRRSREAGFEAHIVKPINFEELSKAVQKLLTHSR